LVFLVGDNAGVRHLAASIKTGTSPSFRDARFVAQTRNLENLQGSPRETEYDEQRAIQLLGRSRVDAADHPSDTVPRECDHLVSHDLGTEAEAILRRGFDLWPER
jgi:hypothetical protein